MCSLTKVLKAYKRKCFLLPGTQASCSLSREMISCCSLFDSVILATTQGRQSLTFLNSLYWKATSCLCCCVMDLHSTCSPHFYFFICKMKICKDRRTRRSDELMRKCREPSQEDRAAVGPTQDHECELVKGNPLSLVNEVFMTADHDKGYNANVAFSKIIKFEWLHNKHGIDISHNVPFSLILNYFIFHKVGKPSYLYPVCNLE